MSLTNACASKAARINPEFRGDWEHLQREANSRREAALARKEVILQRIPNLTKEDQDHIQQVNAEWEEAHQLGMKIMFAYQHATFEDALAWLNSVNWADYPVVLPDMSVFDNLEHLMRVGNEAYTARKVAKRLEGMLLEVSQKEVFAPFADPALCSAFTVAMPRVGYHATGSVFVQYTVCEIEGAMHVAMQTASPCAGPINLCEPLIREFLEHKVPHWDKRTWFGRIRSPEISFYTYMPPVEHVREMFDRVVLVDPITSGRPISVAGWEPVGCVPAIIRPNWLPQGLADLPSFEEDSELVA